MTSQAQNVLVIVGCLCVLLGMFRLILVNHRRLSRIRSELVQRCP